MSEKEFAVIKEISQSSQPNQRAIAQKVGISVGLVNLIIQRFAKKGYVKLKEIPPRRVCYMLTPKGMAEKARKSYDFTAGTMRLLRSITSGIEDILMREYRNGMSELTIRGDGELAALAEMAFRNLGLAEVKYSGTEPTYEKDKTECFLLIGNNGASKKIDVVSELATRGIDY